MADYTHIPEEMRQRSQWLCWNLETTKEGKLTKVPKNPHTGRNASSTFPATWSTFEHARGAAEQFGFTGIGFAFKEDRAFTGLDLDHVLTNGKLDDSYAWIVDEADTYTEVSPSGDGLHLFFLGGMPEGATRNKKVQDGGAIVEMYDHGRFFTVTGELFAGAGGTVHGTMKEGGDTLNRVYNTYIRTDEHEGATATATMQPPTTTTLESHQGALNDEDRALLEKMYDAEGGNKIRALMGGDTSMHGGDDSAADQALCNHLAFWTGRNPQQMDRIFRASGLMRDKWDERRGSSTYGERTILKAIKDCRSAYGDAYVGNDVGTLGRLAKRHGRPPVLKHEQVNDRQLAELFAIVSEDVRFVAEFKRFVVYNGSYWQIEGGQQLVERRIKRFVLELIRAVARRIYEVGDSTPWDKEELEELRFSLKLLCQYNNQYKRASLVKDAASERGILCQLSQFDQRRHLLNVKNGTLDLNGGIEFRQHDPRDMITRLAPVKYDPTAECPLFINTVMEAFEGDLDMVQYLQKWFGIIIAGVTSLDKFLLCGLANRAGKDTLFGTLGAMLGYDERSGYACVASPESFVVRSTNNGHGPSSDVARWAGKRLILTTEFSEGVELDVELLKRLTGGITPVTARRMRENEFSFVIDGIVVMLANVWPNVEDATLFEGKRPVCIPFEHHLEPWEVDPTLRERLQEPRELSGVLNWALEGYEVYLQEGLDPTPDAATDMLTRFRSNVDSKARAVSEFIDAHLVNDESAYTTVTAMYEAYKNMCGAGMALKRNEFYDTTASLLAVLPRATLKDGTQPRRVVLGKRLIE